MKKLLSWLLFWRKKPEAVKPANRYHNIFNRDQVVSENLSLLEENATLKLKVKRLQCQIDDIADPSRKIKRRIQRVQRDGLLADPS